MFLQVWDAVTGTKQYTFEGHEAPVYSVCTHYKENIQVTIKESIISIDLSSFLFPLLVFWERVEEFQFQHKQ